MSNLEIVNVCRDVILNGVSYCKLCLRTEKERNLVKPKAILTFLKEVPMYHINDISICYMCEAHAASALLFVRRLEFATSAELFFRAMKCVNTFNLEDNVVKIDGQEERTLLDLAMECESLLPGARAHGRLAMTDVLLVQGGKADDEQQSPSSNSATDPNSCISSSDVTPSTPELSVKAIKSKNTPNGRTRRSTINKRKQQEVVEPVIVIDDEDSIDHKGTQTDSRTNDRINNVTLYSAAEVANTTVPLTNKTNAASPTNNKPTIINHSFLTNSDCPLNNIVPVINKCPQIANQLVVGNPSSMTNDNVMTISRIIIIPNASNSLIPAAPSVAKPNVADAPTDVLSINQMLPNMKESEPTFDTAILTPDGTKLIMKDKTACNNFLTHTILSGKDGNLYIPTLSARLVNNQFEYVATEVIERNLGIIKVVTPNEINRNNIRVLKDLNESPQDNAVKQDRILAENQNNFLDLDTILKEKANELQRRRQNQLEKIEHGGKRLRDLLESPVNMPPLQHQNKEKLDEDWSLNVSVERSWTENDPDAKNWHQNDMDDKKRDRSEPNIRIYQGEKDCDDSTSQEKHINNNSEVKRPILATGRIDWEDKIPMDVISFVDAVDPNAEELKLPDGVKGASMGVISEVRSISHDRSTGFL